MHCKELPCRIGKGIKLRPNGHGGFKCHSCGKVYPDPDSKGEKEVDPYEEYNNFYGGMYIRSNFRKLFLYTIQQQQNDFTPRYSLPKRRPCSNHRERKLP